jgi:hypothetical protein
MNLTTKIFIGFAIYVVLRIFYVIYKYESYIRKNRKEQNINAKEVIAEDDLHWIHVAMFWFMGLVYFAFVTMPKQRRNK